MQKHFTGNSKYRIIIILLLTNHLFSQNDEECTFDLKTQTDEFVKTVPEFSDYSWDDIRKEATIKLENGNILVAHRGGCVHFGISGELYLKGDDGISLQDLDYLFREAKWIGKRLFSDSDYKLLRESINNKTYADLSDESGTYILIPHKTYNEFSILVRTEGKSKVLYVGYYF